MVTESVIFPYKQIDFMIFINHVQDFSFIFSVSEKLWYSTQRYLSKETISRHQNIYLPPEAIFYNEKWLSKTKWAR